MPYTGFRSNFISVHLKKARLNLSAQGREPSWIGIIQKDPSACKDSRCDGHLAWINGAPFAYGEVLKRRGARVTYDNGPLGAPCARLIHGKVFKAQYILVQRCLG